MVSLWLKLAALMQYCFNWGRTGLAGSAAQVRLPHYIRGQHSQLIDLPDAASSWWIRSSAASNHAVKHFCHLRSLSSGLQRSGSPTAIRFSHLHGSCLCHSHPSDRQHHAQAAAGISRLWSFDELVFVWLLRSLKIIFCWLNSFASTYLRSPLNADHGFPTTITIFSNSPLLVALISRYM